ncbi:MAG: ATP-binding protein [Deltaproteobacteria bacterium]|jgi:hypothetical protein|nr:ATP-binding protein [Deltaproteobacteria bacterium]
MAQKSLPLDDLTFREIREGNFIYADKTKYIYKLLEARRFKCCFLSRPRRFGKTLLLGTLEELFQGDRELFRGLWIDKSGYKFERHPVLFFSMDYTGIKTDDDLILNIKDDLNSFAEDYEITLTKTVYGQMFKQLLKGICKKHGTRVVILVDEYDAPVTDHILDEELAKANRTVLHDFYRSVKSNLRYIHFAFVTGITRFAMTALDSGPNNFKDISLKPKFAGICGFTERDVNKLFRGMFRKTIEILQKDGELGPNAGPDELMALIKKYYDGYNWLGEENILNPFSILNFFEEKSLDMYWPELGCPSHMKALAKKNPLDFIHPSLDSYSVTDVRKTRLSNLQAVPLLFHSGYLTIDRPTVIETIEEGIVIKEKAFIFRFPNQEVSQAYRKRFFDDIFEPKHGYLSNFTRELPNALAKKDSITVARLLSDILTSISFNEHPPEDDLVLSEQPDRGYEPTKTERYYHAIFHTCFLAAGFEVHSQGSSAHGRNDIALYLNNKVRVVIELKYCHAKEMTDDDGYVVKSGVEYKKAELKAKEMSAALDKAVNQMRDKDYAGPYRAAGCSVSCLAVAIRNRNQVAVRFFEY